MSKISKMVKTQFRASEKLLKLIFSKKKIEKVSNTFFEKRNGYSFITALKHFKRL